MPKKQTPSIKDISIKFNVNETTSVTMTDNILKSFREFNQEITDIKTRALFEVSKGEKTYRKVMYVAQFRKFLNDDLHKRLLAKFFGKALNLAPTFYE